MLKRNNYLIIGITVLLLTWLFVGFFRDDEFYEPMLFVKYRPTLKIIFYSPIGMSDYKIEDLEPNKRAEQIAFNEFVIDQHVQNNETYPLAFLPFVLIQLTSTFMIFGIFKSFRNLVYKPGLPVAHFILCFIPTTIGITFILVFDRLYLTLLLGLIIFILNYYVWILLTKQWKQTIKVKT